MIGKLAGIPYCSAGALAAAAGDQRRRRRPTRAARRRAKSAPPTVQAGTGPTPLSITGKVFLSGPYHGAPLSLAVVTPATAGPFDLGTVVVRVALFVDPETTQVTAVSDPIPDVFGGAQLSIRSIGLNLNRKEFTLNPTSCDEAAIDRDAERRWRQPGLLVGLELLRASAPSRPPTARRSNSSRS